MAWFCPRFVSGWGALGLLVLRIVTGAAFIIHGWGKIYRNGDFVMLRWMGEGAPIPGIMQALAALAEFGGGALLILGLLTPLAALGILGTMIGALWLVHIPHGDPFISAGGASYEPAAGYLAQAILFLCLGPGVFSLDFFLFGRPKPPLPPS